MAVDSSPRISNHQVCELPRHSPGTIRARPVWATVLKRVLDVAVSILSLVFLFPFLLIIALSVKIQDGGPVIYRRRVVGPKGPFEAFKFRSMHPSADAVLNADAELKETFEKNFKLANDPRITGIGAFLRKHSLDELPQLVNVLLGQMSLVGPRMITADELTKYGEHQELLLSIKPGLTGYWQVNGRQNVAYSNRVEMDVHYIKHWSLKLDLCILFQTPWKVLKGEGAV
jgi:lipopolysaccharide/colanic/teichoic acid biosynthesis glycosyltransferase